MSLTKSVLTACCLLLGATASAQITITEDDVPRALGDSLLYKHVANSTTVDVGAAGGPHTWTFDTSTYVGYVLWATNVDKATAPMNERFPDANLVIAQILGPYGFYGYRKLDADKLLDLGMVQQNAETVIGSVYTPPAVNLDLPCTLGTQWLTTYSYTDTTSDTTQTVILESYDNRVDGWGTGTCPAGTYPCLRQNIFQTEIMTYYIRGAVTSADTALTRRYYWLAADIGTIAMAHSMEGDTSSNFTLADDYMVLAQTNVGGVLEQRSLPSGQAARSSPNPCAGSTELRLAPDISGPVTVRVCDASGRVVLNRTATGGTLRLDLRGNRAGLYICTVTAGGRTLTNQLVLLK